MTLALDNAVADLAREVAIDAAGDAHVVGALVGASEEHEGVVSVRFVCDLPGYNGWFWTVTFAVIDGQFSVCEAYLLPGDDALLAAPWIPWSDRVRPGDLDAAMVLPYIPDDARLMPGFNEALEDEDISELFEFGLGRERVLAPEGREAAVERWYGGSHGPTAPSAVASAAACSTCAFFVPLSGSMRLAFGACANEWSPSDGRVVSVDHGCGAHSQTDAERRASEWPAIDPLIDSAAVDTLDLNAPDPDPEPEAEAEVQEGVQDEVPVVDADVAAVEADADADAHSEAEADADTLNLAVVQVDAEPNTDTDELQQ